MNDFGLYLTALTAVCLGRLNQENVDVAQGFVNFYVFILEGEEWGGERDCFVVTAYLCIHRLILLCVLTGDRTHNLGVLGELEQLCNQLCYPARA